MIAVVNSRRYTHLTAGLWDLVLHICVCNHGTTAPAGDSLQDLGAGEGIAWGPSRGKLGIAWWALGDPILWGEEAVFIHFLLTRLFTDL